MAVYLELRRKTSCGILSSPTTANGVDSIVDACLASTQALADACVGNDWVCLCTQYQNVLTYVVPPSPSHWKPSKG